MIGTQESCGFFVIKYDNGGFKYKSIENTFSVQPL